MLEITLAGFTAPCGDISIPLSGDSGGLVPSLTGGLFHGEPGSSNDILHPRRKNPVLGVRQVESEESHPNGVKGSGDVTGSDQFDKEFLQRYDLLGSRVENFPVSLYAVEGLVNRGQNPLQLDDG